MKRTLKALAAAFAAAIMVTAVVPATVFSASADSFSIGDVDMNFSVDSSDALLTMRGSIGLAELSDDQLTLADVNYDDTVNTSDALAILQFAVGIGQFNLDSVVEIASSIKAASMSFATDFEQQVVDLCNEERAKRDLPPLEMDESLFNAAEIRVNELDSCCDHIRSNGEKWSTILSEMNVPFLLSGENIAGGIKTPEEVVAAWMQSEGHRENILNPEFNRIGVGYAFIEDSRYGFYWEQIFTKASTELTDERQSEATLLDLINEARKAKGLPELTADDTLTAIADIRADETTEVTSNTRPDGSKWSVLCDEFGYDFTTASQTICQGQQNENEVFEYFMEKDNTPKFLDSSKDYSKIGIGHAFLSDDTFGHYWVLICTD